MAKTRKSKNIKNKTLKQNISIGLKPFEQEFSKKIENVKTVKTSAFVKELLSKFSPSSIKPTNDYYNYINYLWLKNIKLTNEQKYITQIDNFRLTQDKVYNELYTIITDYIKLKNRFSVLKIF
jgi:hypothetical protein